MNKEFELLKTQKSNRVNYCDESLLEDGRTFEDFVILQLKKINKDIYVYQSELFQRLYGESPNKYEIKLDRVCTGYNTKYNSYRLSFEYGKFIWSKQNENWFWNKSGFLHYSNPKYLIQGNPDNFWIFSTPKLKRLFTLKHEDGTYKFKRDEYWPKKYWSDKQPLLERQLIKEYPLKKFYMSIFDADIYCDMKIVPVNNDVPLITINEDIDV